LGVPHIFGQKLLAALSPRSPITATLFIARVSARDGGRRGLDRIGDASCALTFQSSNHSFIQVFEMQLPHFALYRIRP
jgi:hypothetical protein